MYNSKRNVGCFLLQVGSRHPLDDWSNTYIGLHYDGPKGKYKYGVHNYQF